MQTKLPGSDLLDDRVEILDGFRGLAILLVMGYHYFSFFSAGWVGVDLFFVLSGFLITGKLIESANKPGYFSEFYWRRLLRIAPLYYVILVLFFLIIPYVRPSVVTPSYAQLIYEQWYYWTFTINLYNAANGWTDNITFVPFWSVACEMQYYLIWPVVTLLLLRLRRWMPVIPGALFIFALLFRVWGNEAFHLNPVYRYVLLPSRIDSFATGAIVYILISGKKHSKYLSISWLVAAVAIAAASGIIWYTGHGWAFGAMAVAKFGYSLNALFWGAIMFIALYDNGQFFGFFKIKWLQATGRYSYAMYLFHVPVKVLLATWYRKHFPPIDMNYLGVLFLALTLILSVLSYHFFEKRILRYKKIHIS